MNSIDRAILDANSTICENISRFDNSERGLLSQNILQNLRNFVEHISLKIYAHDNGIEVEDNYDNLQKGNSYVNAQGKLKFLSKFHNLLTISVSHYTLDCENSERLMLKYYEYLLKIKSYLKNNYNFEVLENIDQFPINIDPAFAHYHEKIAARIKAVAITREKSSYNGGYYIQKIKPFFVNREVYYEVTFTVANDYASKFDRLIAFTKLDISTNYAVKLNISIDTIEVFGSQMPIKIIDDWEISIRPCELEHFASIFGISRKWSRTAEYNNLMSFLKRTGFTLVEIMVLPDAHYQHFKNLIRGKTTATNILSLLDTCRDLLKKGSPGTNVVRYLLLRLNNRIIKDQYYHIACDLLSGLMLKVGCKPFDQMPLVTSLVRHNPNLHDLFDCLGYTGREHELLARKITNNIETKGKLYTPREEITGFGDIDALMQTYNDNLYSGHKPQRLLEDYKGHIYINGYEGNTVRIIKIIQDLTSTGIQNYSASIDAWLPQSEVDDYVEKAPALKKMFDSSSVSLVYGAAGTGKTTLIKHISNYFHDAKKLYLANTNTAKNNLERNISVKNSTFSTIYNFCNSQRIDTEYDLLIIDECSTVSNEDMLKILLKASFKYLILVGDTYQIESIGYGIWFSAVRSFLPDSSVIELTKPFRAKNKNLLILWNKVRNLDDDILEHITKNDNRYSSILNESVLESTDEDEIILCLNYDGLYGINNVNCFLQGNNTNKEVTWGVHAYKIGDPILFNESRRFMPSVYNNQKGKIMGIDIKEGKIWFAIELDKIITDFEAANSNLSLVGNSKNGNSIVRFYVDTLPSTDDDDSDTSTAMIPFQVSYAVSIHKAQGLEYNSVKVVIANETEEMVTHNIFYTAITRA
ncbi:MAG: AAA family ATPase, partial [Candidatus Moranbacteria bacterium]|nr:AAA family ATPase [Candidatus Moranbacteria bacterium]